MHENLDLIFTLTGGLSAALLLGYTTQRLGLSPIVGYLLAGFAVGPHTPGFIANQHMADQLAEIGVILLMFGVGLQFHFKELLEVRWVAVPGALGQSLVATGFGCLLAWAVGWTWQAGLIFGLAISVASTVVLLRVLSDHRAIHTPTGHIAIGWLVVEDLLTVLVLVLLPVVFGEPQEGGNNILLAIVWAFLKLGLLLVFTFWVGGKFIPWLLTQVAATKSRELFSLTVLVLALGIAVGSAKLFGASMALGAFLAGMVVGRSEFSLRAASEALPMRDAFAVIFFVSVGMLFNPMYLLDAPILVLATVAIVLFVKPLSAFLIVWLLGYPLRVGLSVAIALAQIGEFSFILATLGKQLGILDDGVTNSLVAAAILSISVNPLLYRAIDTVEPWLQRLVPTPTPPTLDTISTSKPVKTRAGKYAAIVVGYGPVGRTVARLLHENGVEPTVIDLNIHTVQHLQTSNIAAVYGDATHLDILEGAGVREAIALIMTASDFPGASETIRLARQANLHIRVFARSTYLRQMPALQKAGADVVFSSEGEVALGMTEFLLYRLGAIPEQVERERARIRGDLFGKTFLEEPLFDLKAEVVVDEKLSAQESKGA